MGEEEEEEEEKEEEEEEAREAPSHVPTADELKKMAGLDDFKKFDYGYDQEAECTHPNAGIQTLQGIS